jgi:hypothetical protein
LKTAVLSALFAILLLTSTVSAEAGGKLSSWEISVDFVPPDFEHLRIFLNIKNTGTEDISGFQLNLAADSLEYNEEEKLSFGDDEDSKTLEVTVEQEQGTSTITAILPRSIEPGQSEQVLLDFNSQGLLHKQGSEYEALINFKESKIILENGNKITPEFATGSFRIHTPEGFMYTKHSPDPWRMIWQGVSGFNAHFVLIFNGGTPLTQPISVTFRESAIIKRAVELYKEVKDQGLNDERPEEELDEANRHITNGANYVLTGNAGLAKIELDEAESILSGKSLEQVISEDFKPSDDEDQSKAPINPAYVLGAAILALIIVLVLFGKNIVSVLKGGKTDEK